MELYFRGQCLTSFVVVQDPNYNVGIPVFSIHGNHDDPTGDGALSALDLLSTANFINYFGRSRKIDDVQVREIRMLLKLCCSCSAPRAGLTHLDSERGHSASTLRARQYPRRTIASYLCREEGSDCQNGCSLLYGAVDFRMTADQVKMLRPREDPDSWFNLLVLHQNRVKHGATNYIPEEFVPKFIDMVVWGHEHDCQVRSTNFHRQRT